MISNPTLGVEAKINLLNGLDGNCDNHAHTIMPPDEIDLKLASDAV